MKEKEREMDEIGLVDEHRKIIVNEVWMEEKNGINEKENKITIEWKRKKGIEMKQ